MSLGERALWLVLLTGAVAAILLKYQPSYLPFTVLQ